MKKVLFVCAGNAGRHQMAEAFFNQAANGHARGYSAGAGPAGMVDPVVAEAMLEAGVDIRGTRPLTLSAAMLEYADLVINLGYTFDGVCLSGPASGWDWHIESPEGKPIDLVRDIRDQVKVRVEELVRELRAEEILPGLNTALNQT